MNRAELEALLKDLESDRAERTISISDIEKFSEAVCAFANDMPNSGKPGYLFIGATPEGTASGVVIDDPLLLKLAAIRSEGQIQPLPVMNVQKWVLGGGEMAVIEVRPADLPPVRYRGGRASALVPVVRSRALRRNASSPNAASTDHAPGTRASAGKRLLVTWLWTFSA
jgi:predicted HTH transcriptional regulator